MASYARLSKPENLRALVDMGSNGIRFSISSLEPATARVMPTLYQHRAAISLYDAQYNEAGERVPINDKTISEVIATFKHFKQTCEDFGVPESNIVVLATEATRTAHNSEDFRSQIKDKVGWDVTLLPKEEEGRVGAMGVASSLPTIAGLVMDLGGGSVQLSWIIKTTDSGSIGMSKAGAVSLPYGAAAMMRRLGEAQRGGKMDEFESEVVGNLRQAYDSLSVPPELEEEAEKSGGFTLFLSGGGFRGWGYILMSQHQVQPYPIPSINGFRIAKTEFLATSMVKNAAMAALQEGEEDDIFRVSDRRASQVPATSFLITAMTKALPALKEIRFCQGGVREGYLFSQLPASVRGEHPLIVATQPFSFSTVPGAVVSLLQGAFPSGPAENEYVPIIHPDILTAFANLMYYHSSHPKDLQAGSALRSTTTGILANVHGLLHESRVILGLLLCSRWGGVVPPVDQAFKKSFEELVDSPITLWWINYIGAVSALIAAVYPSGIHDKKHDRLELSSSWHHGEAKKLVLEITLHGVTGIEGFDKEVHQIEKGGKKKRWVGGHDGAGHKVEVKVHNKA